MRIRLLVIIFWLIPSLAWPQAKMQPAGQGLPVAAISSGADVLMTAGSAWSQIAPKHIALNRTPPLFDTDEPASLEISTVDVRLARTGGKLLLQLTWRDPSQDAATLVQAPGTPPETRFLKVPTEAEDRFFDAAAVMFPSNPGKDAMAPSLQMGDAEHPVEIYYWNSSRGATVMQAEGRSTTRRTNQSFPTKAVWQHGEWTVTMELPDLPAGTPVAFAVWNGAQRDRDGRKYFSVWQVLQ
jgi:complex iron-sulfur molybdoenzyme family reductase subunit gamma